MPGRYSWFWEDILAVGIEEPTGRFKPGSGFRVQGAVLVMIPRETLVRPIQPSAWRNLVGLPGNCSKGAVFDWVTTELCGRPRSQDAADAYCMALATRTLVLNEQEREVARAGKT
jgi:Holliday junction resolvasome RuvABC endonuclease subunit